MKIKLEQSGGFAGISSTSEQDIHKLPPSIQKTVRDLMDGKQLPSSTKTTAHKILQTVTHTR